MEMNDRMGRGVDGKYIYMALKKKRPNLKQPFTPFTFTSISSYTCSHPAPFSKLPREIQTNL